jgi:putative nucleotidyltransferase with HDIG domain
MTLKLLSQYDKVKPVYFSIDNIWRHSTNVARTAKVIALLETGSTDTSGMAYTAGLMHDLGKVILAANFDTQYHGAHSLARKQQIPLWVVEKDIFGATHGEIGAYMLALWGMPDEVVTAAAMHHNPLRAGDKNFTALTAVHVANTLEYSGTLDSDGLPVPVVENEYLQSLGLADRLEQWRDAQRDPDATRFETKAQRANAVAKSGNTTRFTAPQPEARPNKFGPVPLPKPVVVREFWKWLGIGVGVTSALVFMARIELMRLEKLVDDTRHQEAIETQAVVSQNTAAVAAPVNVAPAPKPAAPAVAPLLSHPSRTASAAPAPTAFDAIKLQAIFFTSQHPSALINGRMASVNQNVEECKVLAISPTSVTLAYQDQRRTLTLP